MRQKSKIIAALCAVITLWGAVPAAAQFTVSGTVSDPLAAPVLGVNILLFDTNQNPIGIPPTITDAAGFYSIANFPMGSFVLRFVPNASTGLLFQDIPITVAGNMTVNASLIAGNILSGFVRNEFGAPLLDIDLNVRDENSGNRLDTPGDNTDIFGFYDIVIPSGLYRISYRPVLGENLIPVELRNVSVTADTAINITMQTGIVVSGTVLGPGLVPLVNADLDVIDPATGVKLLTPGDNTDAFGFYSLLIPAGVYDINAEPTQGEKVAPKEFQNVSVIVDLTLNFQLEAGVLVNGRVFDPLSQVVSGVDIDMTRELTGENIFITTDKTDIGGDFAYVSPFGTFTVDFQPPLVTKLAPVSFTGRSFSNDTTFNINLIAGLDLTGVITNGIGIPVNNVDIDAKDPITGISVPLLGDHTGPAGSFATVLAPGTYNIEVEPPVTRRLAPTLLPSLNLSIDTALSVSLDTGIFVSGVVRDTLGIGIFGIRLTAVQVSSTDTAFLPKNKTDIFGAYSVLLAPGIYDLIFKPDTSLALTDTAALTGVVIAGDTTIDVTLGAGPPPPVFTISGTVVEQGAGPVVSVDVSLLSASGVPIISPAAVTNAMGQYSIGNVTDGSYQLRFDAPPAAQLSSSTVPAVVAGANVTVDATLVPCGGACGCCLKAGDANHDNKVNISDVTFLITRIFAGGAAPPCNDEADANGSSSVNIADVSFLISRIFAAGPAPVCGTTGS